MLTFNFISILAELIYTLLQKIGLFQYISKLAIVFLSYIPIQLIFTPDGNSFCPAFGTIDEIYSKKVYDRVFYPRKGWVVVDIGATFGIYALRASKMVGKKGLVIAIEPEPINIKILKHHIRINKVTNIVPMNLALGDRVDTVKLYIRDHLSHTIKQPRYESEFIMVPMLTFDYVMRLLKIDEVDLVKIDVEGSEVDVIRGIKKTFVKRITMEYHGKENARQILNLLKLRGYKVITRERVGSNGYLGYIYAFRACRNDRI